MDLLRALHPRTAHRRGQYTSRASTLVDGYLLSLRAAGRRPDTITWNRKRLARLVAFTGDPQARAITAEDVRRWLVHVKAGTAAPVSDTYTDGHRKAAAAFFAWAVREGHLRATPFLHVRPMRCDRSEIAVFTPDEVQRLLDAQRGPSAAALRNRTMIAFLFDTGVRVGELVALDVADIDLDAGRAHVSAQAKGRRGRTVPLSPTLRRMLWTYLARGRADRGTTRLFTSRSGRPVKATSVNQWLRRCARWAGLTGKQVSPHVFRHTFATEYLRNGGGELDLQAILGHSTLEMVRRYVHYVQADVAARHATASPLERLRPAG